MYLRSASNGVGKTEHTVEFFSLSFLKANAEIYRLRKAQFGLKVYFELFKIPTGVFRAISAFRFTAVIVN